MIEITNYKIIKETLPTHIEFNTIFDIQTNKVTTFTHGFHKYPAKFIPQIPRWALSKYLEGTQGGKVLDPFCGSGTTIVESLLHGISAVGIDIDPLSVLISKVKSTPISSIELEREQKRILAEIAQDNVPLFAPACETIEHWFSKEYIPTLSRIRDAIDKTENKDIKDLFLVCFSSILRRVSNADDQSQKAYVSHTKIKNPEPPLPIFVNQINYFKERIILFTETISENTKSNIIQNSATDNILQTTQNQMFDLAITSPPYIKAIDYIYNQMVELFWIGDIFDLDTQSKQNAKKKNYIGNKQVAKKDFSDYSPFNYLTNIEQLDYSLQNVFQSDVKNGLKHSFITYSYFKDMETHFKQMFQVLKSKAHYVLVVGNSTVSDIYFDTANFLIQLAERNGFKLFNKWGYKIKNRYMRFDRKGRGGIIDIDWVLDFVKE